MILNENFQSNEICDYLPDSNCKLNKSRVFIKIWTTSQISNIEAAKRYLQSEIGDIGEIILKPLTPEASNATLMLEASLNPRIIIGCSVPSGDQNADLEEILKVLVANGIKSSCSMKKRTIQVAEAPLQISSHTLHI